jgi:hypothetical protein
MVALPSIITSRAERPPQDDGSCGWDRKYKNKDRSLIRDRIAGPLDTHIHVDACSDEPKREKDKRGRRDPGSVAKDSSRESTQPEQDEPDGQDDDRVHVRVTDYFSSPMSRRLILPEGKSRYNAIW